MRNRLLAAFPVALMLVFFTLVGASTLVSAFDRASQGGASRGESSQDDASQAGADAPRKARDVEAGRFESTCDGLRRALHALSHAVVPCTLAPECNGSPLLCPAALDPAPQREYERLRDALHDRCGLPRSLVDFAWGVGGPHDAVPACGRGHDGFEAAARGEARPSSYLF